MNEGGNEEDKKEWTAEDTAAEVEEYMQRLRKTFHRKLHTRLPAIVGALAKIRYSLRHKGFLST
ncbi:hypothetical protein ACLBWS_16165 [Brucellaceae bacterium D45D]